MHSSVKKNSQFPQMVVLNFICHLPLDECCDCIRRQLSSNISARAYVYDICYRFSTTHEEAETRAIFLRLTKEQTAKQFFLAFFAEMGFLVRRSLYEENDQIPSKRELRETIFFEKETWDNIEQAYRKATTIILYVAKDLSNIELCLKDSKEEDGFSFKTSMPYLQTLPV
ncbi:MAG: hypothetical protein WB791_05560 [Waddliaceae bacterium]